MDNKKKGVNYYFFRFIYIPINNFSFLKPINLTNSINFYLISLISIKKYGRVNESVGQSDAGYRVNSTVSNLIKVNYVPKLNRYSYLQGRDPLYLKPFALERKSAGFSRLVPNKLGTLENLKSALEKTKHLNTSELILNLANGLQECREGEYIK